MPKAGNAGLAAAKANKKDEWYTQLEDIEKEVVHYRNYFKGKTVLCNCDDPFESNFFKYFALNFNFLGLKKLIATSYISSPVVYGQLSFEDLNTIDIKENHPYKIEINEVNDENADGRIDITDVEYLIKNKKNVLSLLSGDGDFRSEECIKLLKKADIVCTNPPFSLFKEYVAQLVKYKKDFLIIGELNNLKYKSIFPLIQSGYMTAGYTFNATLIFKTPYKNEVKNNQQFVKRMGYNPANYIAKTKTCWYTTLPVKKHQEEAILYKNYSPDTYFKYDNYDAIEVPTKNDIPCDYYGLMGLPISFLGEINYSQFEIVGESDLPESMEGITELGQEWIDKYRAHGGTGHYTAGMKSLGYSEEGRIDNKIIYSRLIIKRKV